jgi:hypothetical protein
LWEVIHCNDKDGITRVVEPAAQVAAQFGAHLIGLSVTPPVNVAPAGMPGTPDTLVIGEHCKACRKHNPEMKGGVRGCGPRRTCGCSGWSAGFPRAKRTCVRSGFRRISA